MTIGCQPRLAALTPDLHSSPDAPPLKGTKSSLCVPQIRNKHTIVFLMLHLKKGRTPPYCRDEKKKKKKKKNRHLQDSKPELFVSHNHLRTWLRMTEIVLLNYITN